MSVISMKQLLEAAVHFGHQAKKWNPKMKQFIFAARNNIHIINLEETSAQIDKAYATIKELSSGKQNVLFFNTQIHTSIMQKKRLRKKQFVAVCSTSTLGGSVELSLTLRQSNKELNVLTNLTKWKK